MPETTRPARGGASLPGEADFRRRFLLAELPPAGGEPHPGKWIPLSGFADFFKLFEKQKKTLSSCCLRNCISFLPDEKYFESPLPFCCFFSPHSSISISIPPNHQAIKGQNLYRLDFKTYNEVIQDSCAVKKTDLRD